MCDWAMLDIVANQIQEIWGKQELGGAGGRGGGGGGLTDAKAHISLTTDALVCKPCTRALSAELGANQPALIFPEVGAWSSSNSRLPNNG